MRLARPEDAPEMQALMRASARDLFPAFYDERQTASGIEYIAQLDMFLVEDGNLLRPRGGRRDRGVRGLEQAQPPVRGSVAGADEGRLLDPATEPARVRAMFVRGDWTRRGLGERSSTPAATPPGRRGSPSSR